MATVNLILDKRYLDKDKNSNLILLKDSNGG